MRKIIALFLFLIPVITFAQFPNNPRQGSDKTNNVFIGGVTAQLGFGNSVFSDTSAANSNSYIKYMPGWQIVTADGFIWVRNSATSAWIKQGGGGTGTDSAAVLKQVTQISTFSRTDVNQITVIDTIRGGVFYKYTGSDAADNGMIFTDANGSKWLRQTTNEDNRINVQWFGARATSISSPHDSYSDFTAAIGYLKKHPKYRTLYIPYDSSGLGYYYISSEIRIDFTMNINGDGSLYYPKSLVLFGLHTSGFVFSYQFGQSAISNKISDLSISSAYDGTFDLTKHAIQTNSFIQIDNVWIQQYDGDGIHISACATPPSGDNNNYGNSSHSSIKNYKANFCTNGVFIEGCDANILYFDNIDCAQNRRWGVFDNGMLGSTYIQPHFAFNGSGAIAGSKTVVSYGGKYYAAIPGHDGYFGDATDSNYNKQPDLNLGTYWQEVSGMTTVGAWSSSFRYYSGGTICIRNANAWSSIVAPYSEAFQPPGWLNSRSYTYSGDNAAGVSGGVAFNVFGGAQYMTNGNFIIPNSTNQQKFLTVGSDIDYAAPLTVVNDADITGALPALKIETLHRNYTGFVMKNASGTGAMGYGNGTLQFATPSNSFFLGDAGFYPYYDNTMDIGISGTNRWRNVYAVNYYGNGASLAGVATPSSVHDSLTSNSINFQKGSYTPTLFNTANVSSSTAYTLYYQRTDSTVTVWGDVDIDPTTTLTLTQLGISLPFASDFTGSSQLAGTAADELGTSARIKGDITNDRAEIRMTPTDITNRRFSFSLTYTIL